MPNTYTQIYIHFVFAVKYRHALIGQEWREEVHKYITGIVQNREHKLIAINSMPDHMHVLIGLHANQSLSDLMRDVKAVSSKFINEKRWTRGRFSWQEGFGAFSYSHSQLDAVVQYIRNQEKHHRRRTFQEEYVEMLKKFHVDFRKEYVFQPLKDE